MTGPGHCLIDLAQQYLAQPQALNCPFKAIISLQRRLSSAHRAPSRKRSLDLPTTMDSHGNRMVQVEPGVTAPVDAVMMPMDHVMSGPGCLSLFNSAGAMSGKRFVRTAKPAAGSSLNVSTTSTPVHQCMSRDILMLRQQVSAVPPTGRMQHALSLHPHQCSISFA